MMENNAEENVIICCILFMSGLLPFLFVVLHRTVLLQILCMFAINTVVVNKWQQ